MKTTVLITSLFFIAFQSFCQNAETVIFLNSAFEKTDESRAVYKQEMVMLQRNTYEGIVTSLKDGSLKMKGRFYYSGDEFVEHGKFTFYHANGQIESEGFYVLGYKSGVWKRFSENGNVRSEKFYDPETAKILMRLQEAGKEYN